MPSRARELRAGPSIVLSAADRLTVVRELRPRGTNLNDEEAHNHVSFIELQAPLPGRNIALTYRLIF